MIGSKIVPASYTGYWDDTVVSLQCLDLKMVDIIFFQF